MRLWTAILFVIVTVVLGHRASAQSDSVWYILPTDSAGLVPPEAFLEMVIQNHPVARQASLLIQKAEALERAARGQFDPKAFADWKEKSFDGKTYYTVGEAGFKVPTWFGIEIKTTYQVARGSFLNPENFVAPAGQGVAGLSVPLLRGMFIDERRAALAQAKLFEQLNEAERQLLLNDLLLDAIKAYWKWSEAYSQLLIFDQAVEITRTRLEGIVESFRVGDKPAIDTLETFIQLQTRIFERNTAFVNFQNSRLNVSRFLWAGPDQALELAPTAVPLTPDVLPLEEPDPTLAVELGGQIPTVHPELQRLVWKGAQLEVERRFKAEQLKPTLDFEYNFLSEQLAFFQGDDGDGQTDLNDVFLQNYKAGLRFEMPIFLRKERGSLQITDVKIADNQLKLQQKELELGLKLQAYYNDWRNFYEQTLLYREMVANYQSLLNAELAKFRIGESSIFLLNSRETKLLEAQIKLLELETKFRTAGYQVFWAAGTLFAQ